MRALPALDIGDAECVVGILAEHRSDVENHERQDHLFERNLIDGFAARIEMRRRIDMRAVLPDHRVEERTEAISLDGIWPAGCGISGGCEFRLTKSLPDRSRWAEGVSQIDEAFASDDLVGFG